MTGVIRNVCSVAAVAAATLLAACGGGGGGSADLREVQRARSGDLDIVVLSDDGTLDQGRETFVIEFRNMEGALVDAGAVTTSANMTMPGMTMSGGIEVTPSDVPGRYRANGDFSMAGGWQMKVEWNGPAGRGSTSFEGNVQ